MRKINFIEKKNQINLQYVSDYANEIIVYLKETEKINLPKPNGLEETQNLINENCRSLVIDWLIDVSLQYKLNDDSLYLAVNILDRYIGEKKIQTKYLQLISCAALLIASKFEEIYPPEIQDFCYIMDNAFSEKDLLKMEYEILKTLNFDLLCVSPLLFLKKFHNISQGNYKCLLLAQFILEISLLEIKALNYLPSILASASLYISRKLVLFKNKNKNTDKDKDKDSKNINELNEFDENEYKIWTEELEFYTGYSINDMENCIILLYKILICIPNLSLSASKKKYNDKNYLNISKDFLLRK
jgi:hypothetical protein